MKTELLKIKFSEYCAIDAINSSKLKDFFADPKLFYKTHIAKTVPVEEEARYFIVGRAIHCLCLEPEQFGGNFMVGERRKSTKLGIANHAVAQEANLTLISEDEYILCQTIAKELPLQHEWCKYHLGAIRVLTEIVIIIEIVPGVFLKVMLDRCIEHVDIVYVHDIKSTSNSNSNEFDKALTEYDYLIQCAFYKYVVEKYFGKPCVFIFVFCSKEEPYNIGFIKIPEQQQDTGRTLLECALSRYVNAQSTGIWYPEQVQEREAVIPKWAMQKYLNYINETQLI
jgi:hypothetical protein